MNPPLVRFGSQIQPYSMGYFIEGGMATLRIYNEGAPLVNPFLTVGVSRTYFQQPGVDVKPTQPGEENQGAPTPETPNVSTDGMTIQYTVTVDREAALFDVTFPVNETDDAFQSAGGIYVEFDDDESTGLNIAFPIAPGLIDDPSAVNVVGTADAVPGGAQYSGSNLIEALIYDAPSTSYQVVLKPLGEVTVIASGAQTEDQLLRIDELQFSDGLEFVSPGRVDLNQMNGILSLSEEDLAAFVEMYIAYYDRAPDALGLFYWGTRLSDGMGLGEIAASFFTQDETRAAYPNADDNETLVDTVYRNLFERDADQEGKEYWIGELQSGQVTRGEFILAAIKGAQAETGSEDDARILSEKADIGTYYAVIQGLNDPEAAGDVMDLYDAMDASSVVAARNLIDSLAAEATDGDGTDDAFTVRIEDVFDDPFAVV